MNSVWLAIHFDYLDSRHTYQYNSRHHPSIWSQVDTHNKMNQVCWSIYADMALKNTRRYLQDEKENRTCWMTRVIKSKTMFYHLILKKHQQSCNIKISRILISRTWAIMPVNMTIPCGSVDFAAHKIGNALMWINGRRIYGGCTTPVTHVLDFWLRSSIYEKEFLPVSSKSS